YPLLLVFSLLIGSIDSVYRVAYDSFYPNVIPAGFYRQAYSVSSMLDPLSLAMVPVAAYVYTNFGIVPLLLFNALSFFTAAVFETRIKAKEKYVEKEEGSASLGGYNQRFREGMEYIRSEKGLLTITVLFSLIMFSGGADTLVMPYCRSAPDIGIYGYCIAMGGFILGRLSGGMVQYRLTYPRDKKYAISVCVYIVLAVLNALYLWTPLLPLTILLFVIGILGVTSYNIRIAATQSYVPDSKRARFNGVFQMLNNLGYIAGQLSAGALAEAVPHRAVLSAFYLVQLLAVFIVLLPRSAYVRSIYNQEL
ncbi:MAG: MFS transporter, partial [Oscillospiraceae bacterium]|nr:MFS transporter [Oscillospiraceae bacterium]